VENVGSRFRSLYRRPLAPIDGADYDDEGEQRFGFFVGCRDVSRDDAKRPFDRYLMAVASSATSV
jgi:hypothetical protein